jgi:hypothetical protein
MQERYMGINSLEVSFNSLSLLNAAFLFQVRIFSAESKSNVNYSVTDNKVRHLAWYCLSSQCTSSWQHQKYRHK